MAAVTEPRTLPQWIEEEEFGAGENFKYSKYTNILGVPANFF